MRSLSLKDVGKELLSILMIGTFIATAILVFMYNRDPVLENYDPYKVVMPTWPISQDEFKLLIDPAAPGPMREGSGEVRDPEWNRLRKGKQTVDSMPRNPDGTPKTN